MAGRYIYTYICIYVCDDIIVRRSSVYLQWCVTWCLTSSVTTWPALAALALAALCAQYPMCSQVKAARSVNPDSMLMLYASCAAIYALLEFGTVPYIRTAQPGTKGWSTWLHPVPPPPGAGMQVI